MSGELRGIGSRRYASAFQTHRAVDTTRISSWVERIASAAASSATGPLLDLGCGVGRFTIPLSSHCAIAVGIDKSRDMLRLARSKAGERVHFVLGDIESPCCVARRFDWVLASMVLEHVQSIQSPFRFAAESLRPSGVFVVRTCLPADVEATTWYRFLEPARTIELARTPTLDELTAAGEVVDLELSRVDAYRDALSEESLRRLPNAIAGSGFEVLSRFPAADVAAAARLAQSIVSGPGAREWMAASLLVFKKAR